MNKDRLLALTLDHLDLVRSKPCAVKNAYCRGDVVAAHLRRVGAGNSREKPSLRHLSAAPLCTGHHSEQEGRTNGFNSKYGIDLGLYALQLVIETLTGVEACWHNDR